MVHEGVATLEGFITANINAQVQGYIISRDYKEGSVVKKGDLLFKSIRVPFKPWIRRRETWLSRIEPTKADADVKRAIKLFEEKVMSDQERDTYINSAHPRRRTCKPQKPR